MFLRCCFAKGHASSCRNRMTVRVSLDLPSIQHHWKSMGILNMGRIASVSQFFNQHRWDWSSTRVSNDTSSHNVHLYDMTPPTMHHKVPRFTTIQLRSCFLVPFWWHLSFSCPPSLGLRSSPWRREVKRWKRYARSKDLGDMCSDV